MMQGLSRDTRRSLRRAKRKRGAELNIVSMIDILTVLVFFLLVNSIGVSILGINLPDANAPQPEQPPHALSVIVRDGELTMTDNGGTIKNFPKTAGGYDVAGLAELARQIKQRLPQEGKITLLLEQGIPYDVLVSVMDAVRADSTSKSATPIDLFPLISLGDAPAAATGAPR
ncbi:MAG: hypothetical protein NVS9B10_04840 [Nevskia sp.]